MTKNEKNIAKLSQSASTNKTECNDIGNYICKEINTHSAYS